MKVKNLDIYGDATKLQRLAEEYEYLGFSVVRSEGKITVLSVKPRKASKKQEEKPKRRATKRPGARE